MDIVAPDYPIVKHNTGTTGAFFPQTESSPVQKAQNGHTSDKHNHSPVAQEKLVDITVPNYATMSKADLVDVIETQKARIRELQWHDEIIGNTDLPLDARFAARAIRKFTQTREPCDDGYYKGYLPKMAELAGTSASTISRGLKTLSDATNAIDKQTDEIRDEHGRLEKNVLYFRKNDAFDVAADITPTKELPKHGGNRRLPCPECGCVHRRRKVVEECAACSHKFYENERVIRGDEESFQVATGGSSEAEPEPEQSSEFSESLQLETLPVDTLGSGCNAPLPAHLELQAIPQWIVWRKEPGKNGKPAKVPYNALTGSKADVTDLASCATYEQACARFERAQSWSMPYTGVGFVFHKNGIVGIDQDKQLDPLIDSYTELSYSETGIHTFARGSIPAGRRRNGIELYDTGRFFAWTGKHVPETPITIVDCQAAIDALYQELAPPEASPLSYHEDKMSYSRSADGEILEKARHARNGAKFRALYDQGDISGYASHSEADQALCRMLAYWTDGNVSTICRLFEGSRLMRPKWDREDYRERTLAAALGWRASA